MKNNKQKLSIILLLMFGVYVNIYSQLLNIYELTNGVSKTNCSWGKVVLDPGEEYELAKFDGAGLITYFYITDGRGGITSRNIILRIYWDDKNYPSVNVPLSDFFGAMNGFTVDYESALTSIRHNCYQSYIPMPFSRGARFVLYNDGDSVYERDVAYNIDYVKDDSYIENNSRFHAFWNRSNPTNGSHTILDVQGKGHYIGNFLHVYSESQRWWGEGDTDFFIDGEKNKHTPGTEDEYGACFDLGSKFSYMMCGYIIGGIPIDEKRDMYYYQGDNRMYRWYIFNPVRFKKELKVTMENQFVQPGTVYDFKKQQIASDDYMSIAYYYLEGAYPVDLQSYEKRTEVTKASAY